MIMMNTAKMWPLFVMRMRALAHSLPAFSIRSQASNLRYFAPSGDALRLNRPHPDPSRPYFTLIDPLLEALRQSHSRPAGHWARP